jgi:polyhydroxyalkanoate synthesis regulator phasin
MQEDYDAWETERLNSTEVVNLVSADHAVTANHADAPAESRLDHLERQVATLQQALAQRDNLEARVSMLEAQMRWANRALA